MPSGIIHMWAANTIRVIWRLQSSRLSKDLEYLHNFLLTWAGSLCYFVFHILTFSLIISRFTFPGWPISHLWILLFTFEIITYSAFFLFWRGMVHTVRDIRSGNFDTILTKPISSRFFAFFRNGGAHNLFSVALGILTLSGSLVYFHLPISLLNLVLYILSIFISLWIFHCLSVILISLNFKYGYLPFTQGAVFQIQEIYKYPSTLFVEAGFFLKLLFIPLTSLMSVPAALLLTKSISNTIYVYYLMTALILTLLSHYVWHASLRSYSSASS